MDAVELIVRMALSLVFVISGVAKLLDATRARQATRAFGGPRPLAPSAATLLPIAELLAAALLVPSRSAWWGAILGLAMLLTFAGAVAWQLARGRHPVCHCFGALSGGPIDGRALARNGALTALAFVVAILAWDDALLPGWLVSRSGALLAALALGVEVLLAIAVPAGMVYAVYRRLSRQIGELAAEVASSGTRVRRREAGGLVAPGVGEPAPVIELPELVGATLDLAALRGRDLLLVFVRPSCWACHAILPDLSLRRASPPAGGERLVVSRGGGRLTRMWIWAIWARLCCSCRMVAWLPPSASAALRPPSRWIASRPMWLSGSARFGSGLE